MSNLICPRVLVDLSVDPLGGAATYVSGFVRGLIVGDIPDKSSIVVLISEEWADAHAHAVAQMRVAGLQVDPVQTVRPGTWKARITRGRLIRRAGARNGCSIAFVPRDVAPLMRLPFVMLARNRYAWERYSSYTAVRGPLSALVLRVAARVSSRRAAGVLAVSRTFGDSLPPRVNLTGVVHEGCGLEEHDRSADAPLAGEPLVVTVIANVTTNKRIEDVIAGVGNAASKGRPIDLRVYGAKIDASYARRLDEQAQVRLGASVLQGPAFGPELVRAYRDAHVVAVGGSFETFCYPLVEGMRSGCVVVAPRGPLVEEICGDAAVTFVEGDDRSLGAAIETAAAEWAERSRGGIVRSRAFTWERTVERTMEYVRACAR